MFSLEEMVVKRLSRQTGFPVRAALAKGNLFTGRFHLEEVEITNPDSFPVMDFLSLTAASAHLSPSSLMGKKIEVRDLFIHVRQVTGVRAFSGAVNLEQFRQALERRDSSRTGRPGGTRREVHLARLAIKVDHVATIDYSSRQEERRDYPVLLERDFRDVKDLLTLGPPLVEDLRAAGLSGVSNPIFAALLPELIWTQIEAAASVGR
jgi:hypothetical protein